MNVKTEPALVATLSPTLEATISRRSITLIRGNDKVFRITDVELDRLNAARQRNTHPPP
jgi:hypothetical protein